MIVGITFQNGLLINMAKEMCLELDCLFQHYLFFSFIFFRQSL